MTPPVPAIHLVPYARDPVDYAARLLLDLHRDRLPDLSRVVVVPPPGPAAPRLRRALLARARSFGCAALLGPHIHPLPRWLERRFPHEAPALNDYGRELMIVEALQEHRGLFGASNPWSIAASLAALFHELTLHQAPIPDGREEFTRRLRSAYGRASRAPRPLNREADLVHTLWRAWLEQVSAEGRADPARSYVDRLTAMADAADDTCFLFVGQWSLLPAEWRLIERLSTAGRAALVLHGTPRSHPLYAPGAPLAGTDGADDAGAGCGFAALLDAAFHATEEALHDAPPGPALARRAQAFAETHPISPAHQRLYAYAAPAAELEARAVDLQVRRWLLDGRRAIGIVTADRRLARRVRALLERAGVTLYDAAGWALSTTSAAAALERWLEAVEQDFHHQPLVDALRSPFILGAWDRERLQRALFRFEQDIIVHENIARGMQRYRRALRSRRGRLGTADAAGVHELLRTVDQAAAPLLPFTGGRAHEPARLLDALEVSMRRLGLDGGYAADAAGQQVLELLAELRCGLEGRGMRMTWLEFRQWLGRALEQSHFAPPAARTRVALLDFGQSALAEFDAVIVAGLDRHHLPGEKDDGPFFNRAVRAELGLPSSRMRRHEGYYHFRRLLEAAPHVLLTACGERDGERLQPTPWLEQLQAFHRLAYGDPLSDGGLAVLLQGDDALVTRGDAAPLPRPGPRPAPRVAPGLLPRTLSAGAHQQIIDCPYQFFALRCLGLSPPEPVSERLSKTDYGERIHLILQAFHGGVEGYPGPFTEMPSEVNRDAAAALLRRISDAVFARDLEDNFQHRGWLRRWESLIDDYVDWQIARAAAGWRVRDVEARTVNESLVPALRVTGRLDRIDARPGGGLAIVDYKTGAVPAAAEVHSGEKVQLPFYALLAPGPVTRVEYLSLDRSGFGRGAAVEGTALEELVQATTLRLREITQALRDGAALPAWGDEGVCERCKVGGLCRKQAWLP